MPRRAAVALSLASREALIVAYLSAQILNLPRCGKHLYSKGRPFRRVPEVLGLFFIRGALGDRQDFTGFVGGEEIKKQATHKRKFRKWAFLLSTEYRRHRAQGGKL
jgi:hypothetical protein